MKYYFFNFKTNNVGYHLDLEDFLADKKDLEKLRSIRGIKNKIYFVEDVRFDLHIHRNKAELLKIIKDSVMPFDFKEIKKELMEL